VYGRLGERVGTLVPVAEVVQSSIENHLKIPPELQWARGFLLLLFHLKGKYL